MALRTLLVRHTVALLSLVATSAVTASAHAQEPPATITLDRMDTRTRLGIQVGLESLDSPRYGDGFLMRYEPYAQYVLANRVIGFYGALPLSHVFGFDPDYLEDKTGVGNLDLGLFVLPTRTTDVMVRVGLALPTASTAAAEEGANLRAGFERLTDYVLGRANQTTLRLALSTLQGVGRAFFRGDLGLDLAVDKPERSSTSVWGRLNVAAGYRFSPLDLSAELVSLAALNGNQPGDDFLHTLTFGLCTHGADQLHAGFVLPLDDFVRGDVWVISVGYQHVMR